MTPEEIIAAWISGKQLEFDVMGLREEIISVRLKVKGTYLVAEFDGDLEDLPAIHIKNS